jgi:hypothetical protein
MKHLQRGRVYHVDINRQIAKQQFVTDFEKFALMGEPASSWQSSGTMSDLRLGGRGGAVLATMVGSLRREVGGLASLASILDEALDWTSLRQLR